MKIALAAFFAFAVKTGQAATTAVVGRGGDDYALDGMPGSPLHRHDIDAQASIRRHLFGGVSLVKKINVDGGSFPEQLTIFNNKLYFSAFDCCNGRELWVTDGSELGTNLVKDISPASSSPARFTPSNNTLFFVADDGTNGRELWRSDGSEAGTQLIKDINPGRVPSAPLQITSFNNKVYFEADDGTNGRELWVSDGSEGGTKLVADINPGSGSSDVFGLVPFDNRLYFGANDGINGKELWVTNGTDAQLVKDINPGSGNSFPSDFIVFNNKLYFAADDGTHGRELWVTDGTDAGTQLVADINPNGDSDIFAPVVFNNRLYFSADSDGTNGFELWASDGTAAGTNLVKDIRPVSGFTVYNGKIYFRANDGINGNELWVSDGSEAGTSLVKDIFPGVVGSSIEEFVVYANKLYFSADDGNGQELWESDGTEAGTQLCVQLNPGPESDGSFPRGFIEFDGKLFFAATTGSTGRELFWFGDENPSPTSSPTTVSPPTVASLPTTAPSSNSPTNAPTADAPQPCDGNATLVKDINPDGGSSPSWSTVLSNKLYFNANDGSNGFELWVTDGTAAGTTLLANINPNGDSNPAWFTLFNNKLYFIADDGSHGTELWATDGTESQLVKDINPGSGSSSPAWFTVFNNKLYFRADDGSHGTELWVTDGSEAGTTLVVNLNTNGDSNPAWFTLFDNKLYFAADDGSTGRELWVTDGTAASTELVKDIRPGSEGSIPGNFIVFNNKLYFSASDGTNGEELWVTNGSEGGTEMVADINPTGNSAPASPEVFNGKLYFSANDGINGKELWVTNGTDAQLVKDINPGSGSSGIFQLTAFDNNLIFRADDGMNGDELWVSDGSEAGTFLLKDIQPGEASSFPLGFTIFGDKVYFVATDSTSGRELWVTDGTSSNTQLCNDINPGPAWSSPNWIVEFDAKLFFAAETAATGTELFSLGGPIPAPSSNPTIPPVSIAPSGTGSSNVPTVSNTPTTSNTPTSSPTLAAPAPTDTDFADNTLGYCLPNYGLTNLQYTELLLDSHVEDVGSFLQVLEVMPGWELEIAIPELKNYSVLTRIYLPDALNTTFNDRVILSAVMFAQKEGPNRTITMACEEAINEAVATAMATFNRLMGIDFEHNSGLPSTGVSDESLHGQPNNTQLAYSWVLQQMEENTDSFTRFIQTILGFGEAFGHFRYFDEFYLGGLGSWEALTLFPVSFVSKYASIYLSEGELLKPGFNNLCGNPAGAVWTADTTRSDGSCGLDSTFDSTIETCTGSAPTEAPTLSPESQNLNITCISVIDESSVSRTTLANDWQTFRSLYPGRNFCLLKVIDNGSGDDVGEPPAFLEELMDPNGKVIRHENMPRDNGNLSLAADWFSLCELGELRQQGFTRVAYFVDDSGSMTIEEVQGSLDLLIANLEAEDVELVEGIVNSIENWISPFLRDF